MSAREGFFHTENRSGDEHHALQCTPTNDRIEAEVLLSFCNKGLNSRYATEIIVFVSIEASKLLDRELLTFLHASALNAKDYETKPPFSVKLKQLQQ